MRHTSIMSCRKHTLNQQFLFHALSCFVKNQEPGHSSVPSIWDNTLNKSISEQFLGPILLHVLKDCSLPEDVRKAWQYEQKITFVRNTRAASAAVSLFRILFENNITAAVMRGLPLAYHLYAQPYLRPMADVDVLIDAKDCSIFESVLAEHGIKPVRYYRSQLVYRIDDIVFEVHYSLLTPKRYRSAIDHHMLLENLRITPFPEGPVACVSLENELFIAITHTFAHHELSRLLSLVDVGFLIKEPLLDWEKIHRSFQNARMERIFLFTLFFVDQLLNLDLENSRLAPFVTSQGVHEKYLAAYRNQFFNEMTVKDYLMIKRNLFRVSETLRMKMQQFFRLFSRDEICRLINAAKPSQKRRRV